MASDSPHFWKFDFLVALKFGDRGLKVGVELENLNMFGSQTLAKHSCVRWYLIVFHN